jgi:hypothetical protein
VGPNECSDCDAAYPAKRSCDGISHEHAIDFSDRFPDVNAFCWADPESLTWAIVFSHHRADHGAHDYTVRRADDCTYAQSEHRPFA